MVSWLDIALKLIFCIRLFVFSRCLLIEERSEFLGVYLRKSFADRTDFSVGFSVAIKTKGEAWTLKHSAFFLKSCDEMFKDGLG